MDDSFIFFLRRETFFKVELSLLVRCVNIMESDFGGTEYGYNVVLDGDVFDRGWVFFFENELAIVLDSYTVEPDYVVDGGG